ncbi:MAG: hypothetical protein HYY16_15325 [Planctomycetes bacterium]|nr:hypothetical protein [Planctomycetota bacterium]
MTVAARPRLGALLISRRLLTPVQLRECLDLQENTQDTLKLGQILQQKGYVRATEIRTALRDQQRRPESQKTRLIAAVSVVLALGLVGGYVVLHPASSPSKLPPKAIEQPQETAVPPSPPPAPPIRRSGLDAVLEEAQSLAAAGKYGAAVRVLDEFPTRLAKEPDAASRIAQAREEAMRKATTFGETKAKEAEALASSGRLREAVDHLRAVAELEVPSIAAPAYERLRRASAAWLASCRTEADGRVQKELAALVQRYISAGAPADPEAAWKEANTLLETERWSDAVTLLTSLAAVPAWRERAILARVMAHYASDQFVGVLLDTQTLLEMGAAAEPAIAMLNRAVTRAPLDETALCLYERALQKSPTNPDLWLSIIMLHTWRHDIERAAHAVKNARTKGVRFQGAVLDVLDQYVQLRERGFPHGQPVYVDYVGPYEILTDSSPDRARKLADDLEAIAKEYEEVLPYARNPNLRFRVMFFANFFDYNEYYRACDTRGRRTARERGAGAYYAPGMKQLVVWEDPEDFHVTLRHEAYHQFLDTFANDVPRWFNEGTASYMESSRPGRPGLSKRYVDGIRMSLDRLPSLRTLVHMPVEKWVGSELEYFYYCQASSFIYWLRLQNKGAVLDDFLRMLVVGYPPDEALARTFDKADLDALEQGWREAAARGFQR